MSFASKKAYYSGKKCYNLIVSMGNAFKFKSDKYRKNRGGYSRFLHVFCASCKSFLLLYQKDGPGPLKRMYMDRIFTPEKLSRYQYAASIKNIPNLMCSQCNAVIGTPYIYEKEARKAFLLNPLSFTKKIGKGILPAP